MTEAKYIALSQSTREILPLQELLIEFSTVLNIPETNITTKFTVFEDNQGAKELANTVKHRPRTKHIVIKYHHFRSHVQKGQVKINSIDTKNQLADTFTKPLPKYQFETLIKQIQGWLAVIKPIPEVKNELITAAHSL